MTRILFFDGYCSLCNGLVDRMIHWDKSAAMKFASLQGETASQMLPPGRRQKVDPDTVLYLRGDVVFDRSTAILMCLRDLGGLWPLTSILFIVPRILRDMVYRFVAATRYRFFGKRDTCRMPTAEERARLLP